MSVRVGMVSFAHVHAPAYAAVLRNLDEADFVGIADVDQDRGKEAAERFGVRYFEDAASLFRVVDAVVVCSENSNHARDVIPAPCTMGCTCSARSPSRPRSRTRWPS